MTDNMIAISYSEMLAVFAYVVDNDGFVCLDGRKSDLTYCDNFISFSDYARETIYDEDAVTFIDKKDITFIAAVEGCIPGEYQAVRISVADHDYTVSLSIHVTYNIITGKDDAPVDTSDEAVVENIIERTCTGEIIWDWYYNEDEYSDGLEYNAYTVTHDYYAIVDNRWILHVSDACPGERHITIVDRTVQSAKRIAGKSIEKLLTAINRSIDREDDAKLAQSMEDLITLK